MGNMMMMMMIIPLGCGMDSVTAMTWGSVYLRKRSWPRWHSGCLQECSSIVCDAMR
jgi:hypothetical protein